MPASKPASPRVRQVLSIVTAIVIAAGLTAVGAQPHPGDNAAARISAFAPHGLAPLPTLEPTPVPSPAPVPAPSHAAKRTLRPSRSSPTVPGPAVVSSPVVASGSVQARLVAAWPGDDRKMLSVVACETGRTFNPMIKSKSGKYWGLFQADADFRASYGWTGWGVEEQAAMAWRGFQARGWQPWACA